MIRRAATAAVALCVAVLAAGFVQAEEPAKDVEPYVAAFPYTPSIEKAPNSQGISVAVSKVSFVASKVPEGDETWALQIKILNKIDPMTREMLWFAFPQFQNLAAKLRKDVAEIFFAKGFRVRGPYESYEAVPAAEKKDIDLYVVPKMKLIFTQQAKKWKGREEFVETEISADGTITLEAQNMTNRESLWTRDVPLEKITFTSRMPAMGYQVGDRFNSIMNEVAKGIERQYPALMGRVAASVDPQEMKAMKKGSTGKTGY